MYRIVFYKNNKEIHSAPFQNPDMAIQYADSNPAFKMPHSLGSALWKGLLRPNIVRWDRATIWEMTGDSQVEYHTVRQG